jgi:type II secretory pathway pseudopilin PulG
MAALLVSLAVMAVLMTVALPAWRQQARREREAELAFRGEQYARAVALFRAKNGNAFPASIDVLVQGKFLRKKYLDPITKDEFVPVGATQAPGPAGQPGQAAGRGGFGTTPQTAGRGGFGRTQNPASPGTPVAAGIIGVRSKSQETSIRIYKGQTRYDLWPFVFNLVNRPGGAGATNPGGGGESPVPGAPGRGRGPGGNIGPGRRGTSQPSTPRGGPG